MENKRLVLADDAYCAVQAKIIIEPQKYQWEGPRSTKRNAGIFSDQKSEITESVVTEGPKTISKIAKEYQFGSPSEKNRNPEVLVTMNTLLGHFHEFIGDNDTIVAIDRFNTQLQNMLESNRNMIFDDALLKDLAKRMESFNVGMVYKVQLVVSRVSRTPFAQCIAGKDGMFHRSVKSKQTFLKFEDRIVDSVIVAYKDALKCILESPDVYNESSTYMVEEVQGSRGMTYLRLSPTKK